MERRNNLLEKFNNVQAEVASLLEGIMNEKNEIKTLRDNLELRLKKSHIKIDVLRRQIEFYKVAYSKLKNIFLSGLEVFKQVDFRSNASIELNKFSLEVLQKHFLEYIDEVSSLSEIPTERELERYIFQKNTNFPEDSKTGCRRNIISSSGSDDGDPDNTNLEFGTAGNRSKSGGGTDEEPLRDSGLESVKEEIGASEIDLSDIQFDEEFLVTDFATDEMNKGRSEVVKCGNVTGTQNFGVPSTGGSNTANRFLVEKKPKVVILGDNQPGNENPQGRNIPKSLHEKNCQINEPARGIYNSAILEETPRPESPKPVMFNRSKELCLEKRVGISSSEKHYQGRVTRHETYTSKSRCYNTPKTARTEGMTSTMFNPGRSPVFKDCNPQRPSDGHIEDFSRNCSTPFRQLNQNFGKTLFNLRGYTKTPEKNKVFSRSSTYKKPRREEDGPSDARKLRLSSLNKGSFNEKNQGQGMRSEDRENESLERDRLSDCSMYYKTTEEDDDDDDDDDIIYGSPEKVSQLCVNPRRLKVKQEISEEPSCQPIPQKSAAPDLDETFVSPSIVKKYQMSRGIPQAHCSREMNPGYDSRPFAYQRGPVRKRAERMKLPGQACAKCDKYYNNVYGDANSSDYNRMLNKCSRHRNAGGQDDTPPGYWTPFLTGNEEM